MSGLLAFFKSLALLLGLIERQQQKQAGVDAQRAAEAEDALEATQEAQDIESRVRRRSGTELVDGL